MSSRHFVIYCQGRTGSHLLMSLLNAHPQIHCAGEVLNREVWPGMWNLPRRVAIRVPWAYLPMLRLRRGRHHDAYGAKIWAYTSATSLRLLHATGWRIIHLRRESLFDRALSAAVAIQTGTWRRPAEEATAAITVAPTLFSAELDRRAALDRREARNLAGIPHLPLRYERDLREPGDRPKTAEQLCRFLGVESRELVTTFPPTRSRSYRDTVANYAALVALFKASGHSPSLG